MTEKNNNFQQEAITSIDGRNKLKLNELTHFFSEAALNKYRIKIEIEYLKKLSKYKVIPQFSENDTKKLDQIVQRFDSVEHYIIKKTENKINHDVKAVEYYIREKLIKLNLRKYCSFVHMGLTSEDVNNLAYASLLNEFNKSVLSLQLKEILDILYEKSISEKDQVFLSRTHGQPAIPTTVGKEFANYYSRLKKQSEHLSIFVFEGKCSGAVGNYNAMQFVFPKIDWLRFSDEFVGSFGLKTNIYTTQILPYDNWLEFFHIIQTINGILTDLSINIWQYIMLEIFAQKKDINQVGSSTMPQKINPINFEHAEGSLQFANSMFEMYQRKLICSRLQRDLSDSPVRRTFGEAFGYTILGWKSIFDGLQKISINTKHINDELTNHWEILSEAIQTYLRSQSDESAYESLKLLTQGKCINKEAYFEILEKLGLSHIEKFKKLTPKTYTGLAKKLIEIL